MENAAAAEVPSGVGSTKVLVSLELNAFDVVPPTWQQLYISQAETNAEQFLKDAEFEVCDDDLDTWEK